MTTMPFTQQRPGLPRAFFILPLVILALILGIAPLFSKRTAEPAGANWPNGVSMVYSDHARKHPETPAIRQCLENKGPYQTFRNPQGDYFFLCQLPDGRWGTLIANKVGQLFFEKSAYVKYSGMWDEVLGWLRQMATQYKGPL